MRNIRKRFLDWCPQPRVMVPSSHLRLSKSILASALAAEILLLLVIPVTYYALFAPKPSINLNEEFPLSNEEINKAWPNLPTAQQIVNAGMYACFDTREYIVSPNSDGSHIYISTKPHYWDNTSASFTIQNTTAINTINLMSGGLIPRFYHIFLQFNDTVWVEVPQTYLTNTSHPPSLPSDQQGFLGTGLPTNYVGIALVIIIASALALTGYFVSTNKRRAQNVVSISWKGTE